MTTERALAVSLALLSAFIIWLAMYLGTGEPWPWDWVNE